MGQRTTVPFRFFEPDDDAFVLSRSSGNLAWSDDLREVLGVALRFERSPNAWMLVETMVLSLPLYPKDEPSRTEERFARGRLPFAVGRELSGSVVDDERSPQRHGRGGRLKDLAFEVKRDALAREASVDVDGESRPAALLTYDQFFAASLRIDDVRVLIHGCRPPRRLRLRTRIEPVEYQRHVPGG